MCPWHVSVSRFPCATLLEQTLACVVQKIQHGLETLDFDVMRFDVDTIFVVSFEIHSNSEERYSVSNTNLYRTEIAWFRSFACGVFICMFAP